MTDLETYLRELEELCEKATPGPWYTETTGDDVYDRIMTLVHDGKTGCGDDVVADIDGDKPEAKGNANFIAESRTSIPWLLKLVRKYREALVKMDSDFEKLKTNQEKLLMRGFDKACENWDEATDSGQIDFAAIKEALAYDPREE